MKEKIILKAAILICLTAVVCEAAPNKGKKGFSNKETVVKSKTLNILTDTREFTYAGNVEVIQDDMNLKADKIVGKYNESNEITSLIAYSNVQITKGDGIKAKSDKAEYDAKSEIITLTENPEVVQKGSTLNADKVKIFLLEDRSEAIGEVHVKILKTDTGSVSIKK